MKIRWTYILILSWVIVSLYFWFLPQNQTEILLADYAYSTENVVEGKWWVFLSSIFLHAGPLHLIMNALAFFFFGLATEHELGHKRMLMIFFFGAFAGHLLSSVFYSYDSLSIGASGGVSAVLGTAMLVAPFKFTVSPFLAPAPILLVGIIYVMTNLVGLFAGVGGSISYAAHVGGLLLGLAYGFKKVGKKQGAKLIITGLLLYLLLAIAYSLLTR